MSAFQAIFYGIIQGITEFLPISSSGHLTLSQHLLGFANLENFILFDLVCHLGTLLAIFLVFAKDIKALFQKKSTRLKQIILGTLPLFPLVLLLKPIEAMFDKPEYLGYFFITTSVLLFAGIKLGKEKSKENLAKKKWSDSLIIGIFQAIALFPGVSRSGSTISAARLLGWNKMEAVKFSFLLAIPAILGGTTLKILQINLLDDSIISSIAISEYLFGFFSSFFVGYLSLIFLIRLAAREKLMYFVWYCLILGILCNIYI